MIAMVLTVLLYVASLTEPSLLSMSPTATGGEQNAQAPALTLAQVKGLLSIAAPDATVADEVKSRGTAFPVDDSTLAELRSLGAGPRTLAALKALQPRGTLVVDAHQEVVEVFVDGDLVGQSDGRTPLRTQVVAGEHEVVVRRPGLPVPFTIRRLVEKDRETLVDVASETPVRVGGNIKSPTKLKDVRPDYPGEARSARVQGSVILEVLINADGTVRDARVLRSIPLLDNAAVDAARQWVYEPTLLNGARVPAIMTVPVQFALDGSDGAIRGGGNSASNGYPQSFPVVHAHRVGRCWGTLTVTRTSLRYEQANGGKDGFDMPLAQIGSVGAWSANQFEVVLLDGRKLHFAHGVMRSTPGGGFTLADVVDLRPKEPVIAAIQGAK